MITEHKMYKCEKGHLWFAYAYEFKGEPRWYREDCWICQQAAAESHNYGALFINYHGKPASPIDVDCPTCHAKAKLKCERHGTILPFFHPERGKYIEPTYKIYPVTGRKFNWHRRPEKLPKYARKLERRKERREKRRISDE
jgi:hypothetical protein